LLRGVVNMKESVTYQAILDEGEAIGVAKGKAEDARKLLLLQGRERFGEPSAKIVALLDAVTDLGRLEALLLRLLHAKTWEELLDVNGATRHPRGRRKA
jgi:predicted transposase YdaD